MKWFLIFWAGPIVFLAGWYWLSYYDMSFGIFMLSSVVLLILAVRAAIYAF